MLFKRIIPVLLLNDGSLVKTVNFRNADYIGDPCNTAKIFNELNADELIVLDIGKSKSNLAPDFDLITALARECFMPLTYGGGIHKLEHAEILFRAGVEKISINTRNFFDLKFAQTLAGQFGSQALVASIDVKQDFFGKSRIWNHAKRSFIKTDPLVYAKSLEDSGFGEILITSVDREGTWQGIDLEIAEKMSSAVSIPCIVNGGIGSFFDIDNAYKTNVSAVGVSSYFLYQKKNFGVLVNIPNEVKSFQEQGFV